MSHSMTFTIGNSDFIVNSTYTKPGLVSKVPT